MLPRRQFISGTAGLIAGGLLASCAPSDDPFLAVTLLEGAIPPEVLRSFRKDIDFSVQFKSQQQIAALFETLQQLDIQRQEPGGWRLPWQRAESSTAPWARLVSLGDYWLQSAIAQSLIEPLPLSEESLAQIPTPWQQFIRRNPQGSLDPDGDIWGAPYKAQALVVVYRPAAIDASSANGSALFRRWEDLLIPEMRQRLALPSHPNLIFALLQKLTTGQFNAEFDSRANSSAAVGQLVDMLSAELEETFQTLNAQVRVYDSENSLKALINENVDAVVTWSADVIPALRRYPDLAVAIPDEGSLLSADLWVRPTDAAFDRTSQNWIEFCWKPGPATQISVNQRGISPVFLDPALFEQNATELPEPLQDGLLTGPAIANSELLLPRPPALQEAYLTLWEQWSS